MDTSKVSPKTMSLEEALKLPKKLKTDYFINTLADHRNAADAMVELEICTSYGSGTQIAYLMGPTGVGKSFLIQKLEEYIIKENMPEMMDDPSFIPVISVEAPSSGEKEFPWKIFYSRMAAKLNEPLVNKKLADRSENGIHKVAHVTTSSTIGGLRETIEEAIQYRRTYLIIIDEAKHLLGQTKEDKFGPIMDAIKSLGNIHDTTLLLVGSYDLYPLTVLSGQVCRRSSLVHFERYDDAKKDDVDCFENSLALLSRALPLEGLPDLMPLASELMVPCTGCVGTLKQTLQKVLAAALITNSGKWDMKFLEKAFMNKDQLQKIEKEIAEGAELIKNATFS